MKKFTTEWHVYSEEKPEPGRAVLFATTYNQKCLYDSLVGQFKLEVNDWLSPNDGIEYLAWVYIDDKFPRSLLEDWKKKNLKSERQIRLEKIQELERQIEELKKGM